MRIIEAPPLAVRLALLVALWLFAGLSANPLVRLEALFGLSPAPWEYFTGLMTIFSGMTEAAHRLAYGDLGGALKANFLALPILGFAVGCILAWYRPRLCTWRDEIAFFLAIIAGSIAINIVH